MVMQVFNIIKNNLSFKFIKKGKMILKKKYTNNFSYEQIIDFVSYVNFIN